MGVRRVAAFAEAWLGAKSLEAVRDAAASEVYRSFQKVEETVSRSTSPVPIATVELTNGSSPSLLLTQPVAQAVVIEGVRHPAKLGG
jgi:hypothetical protein